MAEPNSKRLRSTPRQSLGNADANVDTAPRTSTPYTKLRNLAALIRDPSTPRANSTGYNPNGTALASGGGARRTPRARGGPPTTPHALRAAQARRAAGIGQATTPGRERRRRSGRAERETPRDLLRNLSRVLARTTAPVEVSPPNATPGPRTPRRNPALDEDFDIGPDPKAPRLSMPLGDLEGSSDADDAPPRLSSAALGSGSSSGSEQEGSYGEDEDELEAQGQADLTARSMELGRRARPPRHSLAGERFAELARELGGGLMLPAEAQMDDAIQAGDGDTTQIVFDDGGESFAVENTADLRSMFQAAAARRQSRLSEVGPAGETEDEPEEDPTFVFRVPERMRRPSSTEDARVTGDDQPMADDPAAFVDAEVDDDDDDAPVHEDSDGPLPTDSSLPAIEDGASSSDDDAAAYADLDEPTSQTAHHTSLLSTGATHLAAPSAPLRRARKPKRTLYSAYGTPYPPLPFSTIKRLATPFARSAGASGTLSVDALAALHAATDAFFAQAGGDLAAYATHAGRRTIDTADVVALMRRQRVVTAQATPFALARRYLPGELLREIRMPVPKVAAGRRGGKRKWMETIREADESEEGGDEVES